MADNAQLEILCRRCEVYGFVVLVEKEDLYTWDGFHLTERGAQLSGTEMMRAVGDASLNNLN